MDIAVSRKVVLQESESVSMMLKSVMGSGCSGADPYWFPPFYRNRSDFS